ncbi:succinate dehydrogenase/fumarate reductase iron-sulfur subunit [Thermofilum pendens]|uniref:succinate dehydrogenase n=1 Tax=Thermofilum pendens (strain DSM 2475 / Hrk 5) TaxID=368408 RepID=A1RZ94_THEPD|nr:2Fe-2S iron-sulfur cluster-binding protein [Thermofilum pendens]ABL78524.1 succinate dehydrogenase subunit B [Thermofilum pendens Hrk 5]
MRYRLVVRRYKQGWREAEYRAYEVDVDPDTSVLDALEKVSLEQDPTLTFEHACHHGVCGACGMVINGVERLACVTRIGEVARGGVVVVEPLRGFRVVSDLAVDKSRMFSQYALVEPGTLERVDGVVELEKLFDCVECGVCYSACPIANTFPEYLGPSVIALAYRSSKDGKVPAVLDSRRGVWACHAAFECSVRCPVGFKPGETIMKVRRGFLSGKLGVR